MDWTQVSGTAQATVGIASNGGLLPIAHSRDLACSSLETGVSTSRRLFGEGLLGPCHASGYSVVCCGSCIQQAARHASRYWG